MPLVGMTFPRAMPGSSVPGRRGGTAACVAPHRSNITQHKHNIGGEAAGAAPARQDRPKVAVSPRAGTAAEHDRTNLVTAQKPLAPKWGASRLNLNQRRQRS